MKKLNNFKVGQVYELDYEGIHECKVVVIKDNYIYFSGLPELGFCKEYDGVVGFNLAMEECSKDWKLIKDV